MQYRIFGKSGLRVSEICLGTMTFGEEWGWGANREESRRIFDAFTAAGGNFIDTANVYTNGSSEKFVGEFVAAERARFVVATKYTCSMRRGDPNAAGNHRKNLVQSVEESLKRLGISYLDLLWVHAFDAHTPIDETMRALDDLVRSGKVLYVGISDVPAWVVARANTLAEWRGWSPFVGLQIEYSLIERTPERDLLPMAEAFGMTVTPWAPLGGGVLTGKYTSKNPGDAKDSKRSSVNAERLSERNLGIVRELEKIAQEIGKKPAQIALSWLRQRPSHPIPIVGARTKAQLEESLASLSLRLEENHTKRLDTVSQIDLGFPHEFLNRESIQKIVYGGTWNQIVT